MGRNSNKLGFSIVEIILVIIIIGLIGVVGYVYLRNNQSSNKDAGLVQQSPVANDVPEAPTIKSADDLTNAEDTLDSMNIGGDDDNSQLDSAAGAF
jgi:Tfp pilus assembly protein PilV